MMIYQYVAVIFTCDNLSIWDKFLRNRGSFTLKILPC